MQKYLPLIIFSYFVLPFLLRPLDFLMNLKDQVLGLLAYVLFLPMFLVMSLYGFCNIHDVSWGNRPQSTKAGMEHMNIRDEQTALKVKSDYNVYRVKFLLAWVLSNMVYMVSFDMISRCSESKFSKDWLYSPYCIRLINLVVFSQIYQLQYTYRTRVCFPQLRRR